MVEEREAVRAILLTPQDEVLLLRIRLPDVSEPFWIAPGGGREPGETVEDCLRRELREEVGLDEFSVGPLVWRRQHTFNWDNRRICQREQYRIVRAAKFEPRMSDEVEVRVLQQFRWWPAHELFAARERLTPLTLAEIVARYLRDGPPREPTRYWSTRFTGYAHEDTVSSKAVADTGEPGRQRDEREASPR